MPPPDEQPTLDIAALEEQAAAHLESLWHRAGLTIPEEYPVAMRAVVELMQASGYRVDPDFVCALIAQGRLRMEKSDDQHVWSAANVCCLIMECEARRRWLLHPDHLAKLTALEVRQLEAEAAGLETCFGDTEKMDTESMLLLLEDVGDRAVRHTIRVALMARLRAQGAL
ncbi:MAG: hypothetical protein AB7U20_05490 [Planctomycetaceae bacterium]